jgi:DNA-binding NarL/FixJ family response regulator
MAVAMVTVQIYDRHPLFVRGVSEVLSDGGFRVMVGSPSLEVDRLVRVDVFLVDRYAMDDVTLGQFVERSVPIAPVLFVVEPAGRASVDALLPRWSSCVARDAPGTLLVEAVRTVAGGGRFVGDGREVPAEEAPEPRPEAAVASLSPREREVLQLIARGRTHGQIARAMGISRHTVDTYVKRIRLKLSLGNKAELTLAAVLGGYTR